MYWKSIALSVLMAAWAHGGLAAAEATSNAPTTSPMFRQWVVTQSRFTLVGGRVLSINSGAWMFATSKQVSKDGPVREQVELKGNGVTGGLTYTYQRDGGEPPQPNNARLEFVVDITSEGRFQLRCLDKDHPQKSFDLLQVPGQPLSLSLPAAETGKTRVLRAPTLWHLLIIYTADCHDEVVPTLESIRSGWRLGQTVQAIEDELVKMAAVARKSDRKQWETWVSELGDPRWGPRNRADQNLREVGPAVLGYLHRLNISQLDAEQRARIRRIIHDLAMQTGEDAPPRVASMLIEDPLIWLALLSRPEAPTREAAVQQLVVLLNKPVGIDPKAPPDSQAKAREELQSQIEKLIGEASKTDARGRVSEGSDKPVGSK
jgi:hypothetical protein